MLCSLGMSESYAAALTVGRTRRVWREGEHKRKHADPVLGRYWEGLSDWHRL